MSKQPTQDEVEAFINAVTARTKEFITEFLDEYPDAINKKNAKGEAALLIAAGYKQREMVELLLERGADVNIKNTRDVTPLMSVAGNGGPSAAGVVRLLLENGADPDIKDIAGNTALMISRAYGSREIAALLEQWPEMQKQQREQQLAEQKARELAADMADYSSALKRPIRATRPLGPKP